MHAEEWQLLLFMGAGLFAMFGSPWVVAFLFYRYRRWSVLKSIGAGVALLILINGSIALIIAPEQKRQERAFVDGNLRPLASWVVAFRDSHSRLPTHAEFHAWTDQEYPNVLICYFDHQPPFSSKWGKPGFDFLVGEMMGRGAGMDYYRFSDGKSFEGPLNDN